MQEEFKLGDTLLLDRTNGAGMTVRYLLPRTDSHSNQATVQIKLGSEGSKLASTVLSKQRWRSRALASTDRHMTASESRTHQRPS